MKSDEDSAAAQSGRINSSRKIQLQESDYPMRTDSSIKALRDAQSIDEVVDKMIKFREDIESRMEGFSKALAKIPMIEYNFDNMDKQILKIEKTI